VGFRKSCKQTFLQKFEIASLIAKDLSSMARIFLKVDAVLRFSEGEVQDLVLECFENKVGVETNRIEPSTTTACPDNVSKLQNRTRKGRLLLPIRERVKN